MSKEVSRAMMTSAKCALVATLALMPTFSPMNANALERESKLNVSSTIARSNSAMSERSAPESGVGGSIEKAFHTSATDGEALSSMMTISESKGRADIEQLDDWIAAEEFSKVLAECERLLESDENDSVARYYKAVAQFYLHEPLPTVISELDKAIAGNAEYIDALMLRGFFLERMNDFRRALKDFDSVIALQRDNLDALKERLYIHEELKDYRGKIDDYTIVIELYPDSAQAYFLRALAWVELDNNESALADLRKAEEIAVAQNDEQGIKAIRERIASLELESKPVS